MSIATSQSSETLTAPPGREPATAPDQCHRGNSESTYSDPTTPQCDGPAAPVAGPAESLPLNSLTARGARVRRLAPGTRCERHEHRAFAIERDAAGRAGRAHIRAGHWADQ